MHTGVGFYGKDAAAGGSRNVHLSGFAIEGDVRERIDTDQVNAIGGAFRDSSFSGPAHPAHQGRAVVRRTDLERRRRAQHHRRPDRRRAELPHRGRPTPSRGTTSSATAVTTAWRCGRSPAAARRADERAQRVRPQHRADADARERHRDLRRHRQRRSRTTSSPTRSARGVRCTPGSRFGAHPFAGTLTFTNNTTARAGTLELNWNIGLGSHLVLRARPVDHADIRVTGDHYLDSPTTRS